MSQKKHPGKTALKEVGQEYPAVMIALYQHGAGEPPGYILELLKEGEREYNIIPLFETGEVPGGILATHLVFLGGQMSVNDEKEYPWLLQEKQLIRQAIRSGTPILGICLGAHLLPLHLGIGCSPARKRRGGSKYGKTDCPGLINPGIT